MQVICLLSRILGNATVSARLLEALSVIGIDPVESIWLSDADFSEYRAPRLVRLSSELETEIVFKKKLATVGLPHADIYLINSFAIALAASTIVNPDRFVIATDATPRVTEKLHRRLGRSSSPSRKIFHFIREFRFSRLAKRAGYWLPMSHTCKDSLIADYGVSPDRCEVTYAAQKVIASEIPARDMQFKPLKLLFVSNLFELKNGPALCEAVGLLENTELVIVSNDPAARAYANRPHIRLVSGLTSSDQVLPFYREAHLLVHPTRYDQYSNVILEAMSQGCPFLVTEGYGPGELVNLTDAGWHIPWPPHRNHIIEAIQRAIADRSTYLAHAKACLVFAREKLSMNRFARIVQQSLR